MTVSQYTHYYPSSSLNGSIKFQSVKNIQTVTNTYTSYSSDDEDNLDSDDANTNEDNDESIPQLIEDEDERLQLMKLIINIVSLSLVRERCCENCSYEVINKILLNLVNVTKLNLHNFEKNILVVKTHLAQTKECLKYIILGVFINQSGFEIGAWCNILKMSKSSIFELTNKYRLLTLSNEEVMNFNGKLLNLVKGNIRMI